MCVESLSCVCRKTADGGVNKALYTKLRFLPTTTYSQGGVQNENCYLNILEGGGDYHKFLFRQMFLFDHEKKYPITYFCTFKASWAFEGIEKKSRQPSESFERKCE